MDELRSSLAARANRARNLIWHGPLGFLFGYFVLHPVSMFIFHWLDSSRPWTAGMTIVQLFIQSFHFPMLPMGVAFGLVSSMIFAVMAYQRLTISAQKDDLALQLEINDRYRRQLEHQADLLKERNEHLTKLERNTRRTTQFLVHDFKNYLGCIVGFADILLQKPQDAETADGLKHIRGPALRMTAGVTNLLELARLQETGKLNRRSVQPDRLLQDIVGDVALSAFTGVVRVGENAASCPAVLADAEIVGRVLSNLISNAFRHNRPGTSVLLDAAPASERAEVVFSCQDDGAGIPTEITHTIFEEFQTASIGLNRSSGLGLAFCKSAVEAHGGRIWCETTQGNGARFYFTIAVVQGGADNHGK